MQIQPITSFSNNKSTSFKSKLPSVNDWNERLLGRICQKLHERKQNP